ncbi:anti-sigma28 factor (negative regulator of flagellin synthesis) [Streptomonospora salina]|uniref:Anti-sigma28 factor (Negative regulator of flagellin synthesis) n=2 Tax=Streptomonospora salina TaxID=104205 RepID=A0A841ECH8_9ACTN|nr:hypothetical protein [Streptomonospora salina]MBB5998170.1 anti-sigma28 factor (negative regulator of flagellin synthesis) [Streptomonospora salina]
MYTTDDGTPVVLDRKPGPIHGMSYTYRYDVDVTAHRIQWTGASPSATRGFEFQLRASLTWRVSDPCAVVKNRIATVGEADAQVRDWASERVRPLTRRFAIEHAGEAEEHAGSVLSAGPVRLDSGLTVVASVAGLWLDPAAQAHLRTQKEMEWAATQAQTQHDHTVMETQRGQEVSRMQEEYAADLRDQRIEALKQAAQGDAGLLLWFLAEHPDQLGAALTGIAQREDMAADKKLKFMEQLIDKDFAQPADIDQIFSFLGRQLTVFPGGQLPGSSSAASIDPATMPGATATGAADGTYDDGDQSAAVDTPVSGADSPEPQGAAGAAPTGGGSGTGGPPNGQAASPGDADSAAGGGVVAWKAVDDRDRTHADGTHG